MFLVNGFACLCSWSSFSVKDKRDTARMAWLTPIWPMFVPYFVFKGVWAAWQAADWRNTKYDYDLEEEKHTEAQRVRSTTYWR